MAVKAISDASFIPYVSAIPINSIICGFADGRTYITNVAAIAISITYTENKTIPSTFFANILIPPYCLYF